MGPGLNNFLEVLHLLSLRNVIYFTEKECIGMGINTKIKMVKHNCITFHVVRSG